MSNLARFLSDFSNVSRVAAAKIRSGGLVRDGVSREFGGVRTSEIIIYPAFNQLVRTVIVARVLVLSHISFVMVHKFGVLHKQWKTIDVRMQLTCTGGLCKNHEPLESAEHPITNGTFVKITKSQKWLRRMVSGMRDGTCLTSTTLLRTLRETRWHLATMVMARPLVKMIL